MSIESILNNVNPAITDIQAIINADLLDNVAKERFLWHMRNYRESEPHTRENYCVYQWLIDKEIILLYREDDNLSYRYISNEQDIVGPINFGEDNRSIEERISFLTKCLPKLNQDNIVCFTNPIVCYNWDAIDVVNLYYTKFEDVFGIYSFKDQKQLSLIWRPNEFLWNVTIQNIFTICSAFIKASRTSIHCRGVSHTRIEVIRNMEGRGIIPPLARSVVPKNIEIKAYLMPKLLSKKIIVDSPTIDKIGVCKDFTLCDNINEILKSFGLENIASVLTGLKIFDFVFPRFKESNEFRFLKRLVSSYLPMAIYLEPKSARSRIDERVRVSQSQWGVTLIAYGGSSGNHARLIIEGLDHSLDYFMTHIHFTGEEEYLDQPIKPEPFTNISMDIRYDERTIIWKRPSYKVKEMIDHMTGQMPSYSMYGRDSVLSRGRDNCFTWLREELQIIDVDLGTSPINSIAAITKLYTKTRAEHLKNPVNDGEIV